MSWEQSDFANPVVYSSDMDTEFFEYLRNFDADDLVEQLTHSTHSQSNYNPLGSSLTSELFSDLEESSPTTPASNNNNNNFKQEHDQSYDVCTDATSLLYQTNYDLWSSHQQQQQQSIHQMRYSHQGHGLNDSNSIYSSSNIRCNCLTSTIDLNKPQHQVTTQIDLQQHEIGNKLQSTPTPTASAVATATTTVVKRRRRRRKQGEPKSFVCTFEGCNNVYFRSSHLKVHVRKHTGEKPFRCTWPGCEWSFRRSDELSRHKRCHSGIKPYSCVYCSKCFGRSDHLSKHMKVHQKGQSSTLNITNEISI